MTIIYIVCYKDGKISNIAKYEKLSISANGELPYTSGSISYGQADTVRVFVWDSKLSPYASFEPITVE